MFNLSKVSTSRILMSLAGFAAAAAILGLANSAGLHIPVMNSLANTASSVTDKVVLVSWTTGAIAGFLCGATLFVLHRLVRQATPDRKPLSQ